MEHRPTTAEAPLLELLARQPEDQAWMVRELFRRAAQSYEHVEQWHLAAACWAAAGDRSRAVPLYLRQDNHAAVAPLLLAEKRYAEALEHYRAWLQALSPQNIADQVAAQLGLAACLHALHDDPAVVHEAFQTAWALITNDPARHPLIQGHCWEALGAYGAAVGRNDLLHIGYERALRCYGTQHHTERLQAARAYREAVQGNKTLADELETRVAEMLEA